MQRHAFAALVVGAAASVVDAQWTVVLLGPPTNNAHPSSASGVWGSQQVGVGPYWVFGDLVEAALWTGSPESRVSLHPPAPGVTVSVAYAVHDGQQVGYFGDRNQNSRRACLWTGTAESWVDLHPAAATMSAAYGVWGGRQVGVAEFAGRSHASLWTGTAPSWIDLHPDGATASEAHGAWACRQVGSAEVNGDLHASLWTGTAVSWVDLHPDEASSSEAWSIHAGQQVGLVRFEDGRVHAALWTGSHDSWVDLNPPGVSDSVASAVYDGQQVGAVVSFGFGSPPTRATLWTGTPDSCIDLAMFLPEWAGSSAALDIWSDDEHTTVVGTVEQGFHRRAVMWIGPPPCRADFHRDGLVSSHDFFDFLTAFFAAAPAADFNVDGIINSQDVFDFLTAFFVGCV